MKERPDETMFIFFEDYAKNMREQITGVLCLMQMNHYSLELSPKIRAVYFRYGAINSIQ